MNRSRTGLTLVEVIVVLFLGILVLSTALQMWRQYSFEMARTATRHQIQQEARQIMQQLAGDIRSADSSGIRIIQASGSAQTGFSQLRLERVFFRPNVTAPGQETSQPIRYELAPPLLRRTGPLTGPDKVGCSRILGTRVADCEVFPAGGASESALQPSSVNQTAQTASSTNGVEIVLSMSAQVPGSGFTVWHIERTSVFPRAATSQEQHPGSRSLAGLSALDGSSLEKTGNGGFLNSFGIGEQLTASSVAELSDGDLSELKEAQKSNLRQLEEAVSNADRAIKETRPSSDWSWAAWWGETNLEQVQNLGEQIRKADTVEQLEEQRKKLDTFFDRFSAEKLQSVFGAANNASESRQDIELKTSAIRMRIIDRLILIDRQTGAALPGQTMPQTQFEIMTAEFGNTAKQQQGETKEAWQTRRAREEKLLHLYQSCNIGALVGGKIADGTDVAPGKESNEFKALEYAQNCRDLATSKLTALQSKDLTAANIKLIDAAQSSRSSQK